MYQSSFSLPPLSLLYPPLPSLACLDFFFSLVTAQVPVLLLFKKYSGLFLGFLFLFVLLLLFELLVTSTSAPNLSLILEGAQFYFFFLLSIVQIFICIRALQRSFVFSSKMLFFVALLLCYRYWHQFPDVVFLSVQDQTHLFVTFQCSLMECEKNKEFKENECCRFSSQCCH